MDIKEFASKGGLARKESMSPEARSASARKAALARHAKSGVKKGSIKDAVKDNV